MKALYESPSDSNLSLEGGWCYSSPAKGRDSADVLITTAFVTSIVLNHHLVSAFTGEPWEIAGNSEEFVFAYLRDAWRKERGPSSWVEEMTACPSYIQIMHMGPRVVPCIIEQLRREGDNPDHWYVALEALTGVDPVPESAYGDATKIAQAWLEWANEEGL